MTTAVAVLVFALFVVAVLATAAAFAVILVINLKEFLENNVCKLFGLYGLHIERFILFVVVEYFIDVYSAFLGFVVLVVVFEQAVEFAVVLYAGDLTKLYFFSFVVGESKNFFLFKNFDLFFFVLHFSSPYFRDAVI